ncbi:hypothetical protein HYW21_07490 [Candidatus Woesearchaeota archaeon]|nr:hypothetical protein [Candidatus Woesearchaeota archaeon]
MSLVRGKGTRAILSIVGVTLAAQFVSDYHHNHRPIFTDITQTRDPIHIETVIAEATYYAPADRYHPLDPSLTELYGVAHLLAERPLFSDTFEQYHPDTLVEAAERVLQPFWAYADTALASSIIYNNQIEPWIVRVKWYPPEGEEGQDIPFAFNSIDDLLFRNLADLQQQIHEGKAHKGRWIVLENRLGYYFRTLIVGDDPQALVCSHINDLSESFGGYLSNWADHLLKPEEPRYVIREEKRK